MKHMKTGLVLEGGAMRGIYTSGVLDVFLDCGIRFDGVIGVSAGAIHGATYVAEQNGRNIRYYKNYRRDRHFMSIYSLVTTGDVVGRDFCYREIPDRLDPFDYETFKSSPTDFYVVCTDVEKGTPVYVLISDLRPQMEYLRASASMPLVTKIVEAGGRKLLDGGITDSIPLRAAQKLGYDKIVVGETREEGYVKSAEGSIITDRFYRNYPRFAHAMRMRHIMYNEQKRYVAELEKSGEIQVIRPSRYVDIGRMERSVEKIEEMYRLGRYDAENKMRDIEKFVSGE
ncbi:MAG: patatin family protein [Ruminococcus sp.]|nr:patatin family protein [Ruminococcus sp.]